MAARYDGGLGGWRRALGECNISIENYTQRKTIGEPMPWDHIDIGLNKGFHIKQVENSRKMISVSEDGDQQREA